MGKYNVDQSLSETCLSHLFIYKRMNHETKQKIIFFNRKIKYCFVITVEVENDETRDLYKTLTPTGYYNRESKLTQLLMKNNTLGEHKHKNVRMFFIFRHSDVKIMK